jgi:hypothetical protein
MHSSRSERPEVVRDNMGHANICVTHNVYGKSWWEERVDAGHLSCRRTTPFLGALREVAGSGPFHTEYVGRNPMKNTSSILDQIQNACLKNSEP